MTRAAASPQRFWFWEYLSPIGSLLYGAAMQRVTVSDARTATDGGERNDVGAFAT